MSSTARSLALHLGLIALLFVLAFVLPSYHQGNLARIMVLATYAIGYNVLFGYTGLLSLGHAMFFGAGMYGLGLAMQFGGLPVIPAFVVGLLCAAVLSTIVAFLALRTIGVAFMIVTLMFAQAGYLTVLYFGTWTRGDEGFVITQSARQIAGLDLTDPTTRYLAALVLFSAALLITARMMQVSFGSVLIGVRENEERTRMLGYDVFRAQTAGCHHIGHHFGRCGGRICRAVRLCRGDVYHGAIFDLSAALGVAGRGGHHHWAAHRHAFHVLSDRLFQRADQCLYADCRCGAGAADAFCARRAGR